MFNASRLLILTLLLAKPMVLRATDTDETSLFNSSGRPVAYIADDLIIYLWSGKPVAYLHGGSKTTDVYGFNGKHLGWFVNGIVRDHDGNAACGVKDTLARSAYEPYKGYKQYKPYKAYREYAPYQPSLSRSWSETPCSILLALGRAD